tara:strand:- start:49 stop:378 length:330 start_codon:yes stop_codon:yes gene_type:complete
MSGRTPYHSCPSKSRSADSQPSVASQFLKCIGLQVCSPFCSKTHNLSHRLPAISTRGLRSKHSYFPGQACLHPQELAEAGWSWAAMASFSGDSFFSSISSDNQQFGDVQ